MARDNPPMVYNYDQARAVCDRKVNQYVQGSATIGLIVGLPGGPVGTATGVAVGTVYGVGRANSVHRDCMESYGHESQGASCTML